MTDELAQLLKSLGLDRSAEIYDEQLKLAETESLTHTDWLLRLLRPQWHARQEKALSWRIKKALLPEHWTLETFPYAKQPGVNRRQIRSFAELDFIPKAENIVFIGPTGVGKTGLASGLLLKALQNGYRGQFIRAQDLFDEMYASLADRSSPRLVKRLARLDVLVVDELAHAGALPSQSHHHHDESDLRRVAQLPGQPPHGRCPPRPHPPPVHDRQHQGALPARPAGMSQGHV
jgi:DNA replication protein DnaC